jgi:NAD(P)-binding Rossmann-like domain
VLGQQTQQATHAGIAVLKDLSNDLRTSGIDDGHGVIVASPVDSSGQVVGRLVGQGMRGTFQDSLLAAKPSGQAPDFRCQNVTAASLTDRRSPAHGPVDGRHDLGTAGPRKTRAGCQQRQASRAMARQQLGCIGNPSKMTDQKDGAPVSTATVVGSGPNGLAAALTLAESGVAVTVLEAADEIGGGTRSSEALVPGLLHDHCSAIHPIAVGSPLLRGLDRYGLQWRWTDIDCVHPLDGGDAGVLYRSVADTAAALGVDGPRWRAVFGRPSANFDALSEDILGPLLRVPSHPLLLARFGVPTMLPAAVLARTFRTEKARALFGGVAAHTFRPLHLPMTSAIGLGILTAGHRHGWPVAAGGSLLSPTRWRRN